MLLIAGCGRDRVSPTSPVPVRAGVEASSPDLAGQYVVLFVANAVPADLARRTAALGGTVLFSHAGAGLAEVGGLTAAAASSLKAYPDVADVEADTAFQLDDMLVPSSATAAAVAPADVDDPAAATKYARQWHLRAIHADQAWAAGRLGSPDVTVAILDSGIDYTNPELIGHVDLSRSISYATADDALVDALFPGRNHISDLEAHGTHVASTVTSNAIATAGVTSKTTLIGVKVCGLVGYCYFGAILRGVLWAADHGAAIANMSLGGGFFRAGLGRFMAYVNRVFTYAYQSRMLVVASAGNDAADLDHNGNLYQAMCDGPNVVCVSATGPTASADFYLGPWQNVDAPAPYTNYGRSAIDVAAPGGTSVAYVWAACSQTSLLVPICQTGFYSLGAGGTSMAAPHASGVAALIAAEVGRDPARIKARLEQSADDLGAPGMDPYYGHGRINAARAVGL